MYSIFALLGVLLIIYILTQICKPKNYPPGPPFIPIIGHFYKIRNLSKAANGLHFAFSKLAKKYSTSILGLKFGNELTVVVLKYPLIRRVLTEEVFEGRPDNFFMRLRTMGKRRGITSNDGEVWSIQRNFLIKNFRNLGFGKDFMSTLIKKEVANFIKTLPDSKTPIKKLLAPSVINIFWYLASGSRISGNNPKIKTLIELLNKRSHAFDMSGGLLNMFPWLRFIIPEKIGYDVISEVNLELYNFFKETIEQHYDTANQNEDEDLIYLYIKEIQDGRKTFAEDQLIMVLLDLFIAGSQTTSTTLDFAFMMMIIRPDLQEKIQRLLNAVFDKTKEIDYSERHCVPYVEAFLMEVLRYFVITPIIGPRRALQETELDGYTIPKDTTILIHLYSLHRDESHWKDSNEFRPERFLNDAGGLIHEDYLIPFGLGKRRCLGEVLARNCLFTFFSEVIRKYEVKLHPDSKMPSMTPDPGIVVSPKPYFAEFSNRY